MPCAKKSWLLWFSPSRECVCARAPRHRRNKKLAIAVQRLAHAAATTGPDASEKEDGGLTWRI
jgi:hypothetical protein